MRDAGAGAAAAAAPAPHADPFPRSVWPRVAALALFAYVVYACAQLDVSWDRVVTGLDNASRFFHRLFPPNFARWKGTCAGGGSSTSSWSSDFISSARWTAAQGCEPWTT